MTGGLAVTNQKLTQTTGILNASTFNSSIDATRLGWVFGGGLEYALGRNWTIRAEYLHLDFGTTNGSGTLAAPAGIFANALCAPAQTPFTGPGTIGGCSISSRLTAEVVRAGITYRFDSGGPVVARY